MGGGIMTFVLEIYSESELEHRNKKFLDEEEAIAEALKKNRIVAYY